ncbi:MAG: hypothetical protein M1818_001200 [Claussenomyces sp. TS43310]|nr:MAG: hypothetical protein M1818_001200 [Claussenomyces sp. TS43310]
MAPTRRTKKQIPAAFRSSSTPSENDEESATTEAFESKDLMKLAEDLVSGVSLQGISEVSNLKSHQNLKRREAKRKAIQLEHAQRIEAIRMKIENLYEERKSKVIQAQNVQWDALTRLLEKRQSIEARIISDLKSIEQTSLSLAREIIATYDGRLQDIAEVETTGEAR